MDESPRRRTKAGERRRQALIEAAVDLIEGRGVGGVRAADVSRAAGLSASLFYWYFRDFDDLLTQAIIDARRMLRAELTGRMANREDVLVRFAVMVHDTLLLVVENPSLRVLLSSQTGQDPSAGWVAELRKTATTFMHDCELLLSQGQVRGTVRADMSARYLSYFVRSLVHDTIQSFGNGLFEADLAALAEQATRFCLRAVATDITAADRACDQTAAAA
jgi:AcrR family transcriptional regulator